MEQAVIVHMRLCYDGFTSLQEHEALLTLQKKMAEIIEANSAGEFDGDEFGQEECILYMYGPDANWLFASIEPLLKGYPRASGGYAIKRYGEAGDPTAREVRVTW